MDKSLKVGEDDSGNAAIVQDDDYESAEALMEFKKNPETKWIMDSGCLGI